MERKSLRGMEGKRLKDNRSYENEESFGVIKSNNGKVKRYGSEYFRDDINLYWL